uniref:Innexin n=1 Tax=Panagrolaimus sp. ES5 TaxID=591445 RepID=A0AC34G963_9BILA
NIRAANIAGLADHLGSIFKHRYSMDHRIPFHKQIQKFINIRYYEAYLTWLYLGIKLMFFLNVMGQMFLMNKFLQTDDYDIYGIGVIRDLLNNKPWSESGNFPRVTYCDMDIRILGNVQRHTVQCVLDGAFVLNMITIHSGLLMCAEITDYLWEKYKEENGITDGKSPLPGLDPGMRPPDTPGFASRRKTSVLMPLVSRDDMSTPQPTASESPFLRAPSTAPVK